MKAYFINETTEGKWYNNGALVFALVFILPPLGMYAIYKMDVRYPQIFKLTYGLLAFGNFLLITLYILHLLSK